MTDKNKINPTKVRTSNKFKLKLKYEKDVKVINLKDFGFYPETLIFQRVESSWFTVSAIIPPGEIKKMEREAKAQKKKEKAAIADVKKTMKEMKK